MADGEGFEPPIPFQVCRFSRPEPSTARPPIRRTQRNYTERRFHGGCFHFAPFSDWVTNRLLSPSSSQAGVMETTGYRTIPAVLKTVVPVRVPGVRIPRSPP